MMTIKMALYEICMEFVNKRSKNVERIISSHQMSLGSETKSSAGDKHETGRAMLQLEMEKAGQQLAGIDQMKSVLTKMTLDVSKVVKLGSLVVTDRANYFLAISVGKIIISDTVYYAISPGAPIGKLLLGKKVGDRITFNQPILIQEIY